MSFQRVVKQLQSGAVLMSSVAMLGACGGPLPDEEGVQPPAGEEGAVTASVIPSPTATMNCTKSGSNITCTGSGSGGVTPYTYQWSVSHDFGSGPGTPSWFNGTTTYNDYCQFGLYTYGTYFTKYIRFRVVDANTYQSNEVTKTFRCWSPN